MSIEILEFANSNCPVSKISRILCVRGVLLELVSLNFFTYKLIGLIENVLEHYKNILELYKNILEHYKNILELIENVLEHYKNILELIENILELIENELEHYKNILELYKNVLKLNKIQIIKLKV